MMAKYIKINNKNQLININLYEFIEAKFYFIFDIYINDSIITCA